MTSEENGMKIGLTALTRGDKDTAALAAILDSPSVRRYISVAPNYFDYVTGTADVVYYKILSDGVPVGGVHLETDGETCYLAVCVAEGYRRRGIAGSALRLAESLLPEEVKTLEVSIDETNLPSLSLFEKLGYTSEEKEDGLIVCRKRIGR